MPLRLSLRAAAAGARRRPQDRHPRLPGAGSGRRRARVGTTRLLLAALLLASGCGREPAWQAEAAGGDADRGAVALRDYGCVACHEIRGVPGAIGRVGPSLSDLRDRTYIAGALPNDPETLIRWIMSPSAYRNPTAMPDLGVTEADARDIATYLYSLR